MEHTMQATDVSGIWGMHFFWWAFWIFAMISVFGFNLPERAAVNSLDADTILRRRLAKGAITETDYQRISALLVNRAEDQKKLSAPKYLNSAAPGHPIVDGLSFTVTWLLSYSLCSLIYFFAPAAMTSATGKLFHGMNFTQMSQSSTGFGFNDFIAVLTLGAVYTFTAGLIWSLTQTAFRRLVAERRLDRASGAFGVDTPFTERAKI
jgi:hypothetical protein